MSFELNSEDVEIPPPTIEESKEIKAINKETVHRICSGQVVLSLAIAVKELVENSIDAGATVIEVKLKEQGLEYVEVCDNGHGVREEDIKGMTAKYHTSKIKEFSDLNEVATFGFRGEALSSLCALSDMKVITKHKSSPVGVSFELDHEGQIRNKSVCPREVGTTVTLSNLFSTLPVRKREFSKNIKKEFAKMCQILQAYCLVSKGIKIMCSNISDKGRKTNFLSTQGSHSVLDNIVAIFGSKQSSELVVLKPPLLNDEKFCEDSFLEVEDVSNSSLQILKGDIEKLNNINFEIEGWISSCSHGSGRSSKDRQYFFINSRPCDNKNLSKLVNEIYHRYNVNQYPFVFLNLKLNRSDVDVNVTPDKRQLFLNNEKILLLAVKKSLLNTFGNIPSTYKIQNSTLLDFNIKSHSNEPKDEEDLFKESTSQNFMQKLSQWKLSGSTDSISKPLITTKRKTIDEIQQRTFKLRKIQDFLSQQPSISTKESFASYKSDEDVSEDEKQIDSSGLNNSVNINMLREESKEYDFLLKNSNDLESSETESTTATKTINVGKNVIANSSPEEMVAKISCKNVPKKNDLEENLLFEKKVYKDTNEISNSTPDEMIKQDKSKNVLKINDSEENLFFEKEMDNDTNEIAQSSEEIITQNSYENVSKKNDSEESLLFQKDINNESENSIYPSQSTLNSSQDSVICLKNDVVTIELDEATSDTSIEIEANSYIETSIEEIRKLALAEDEFLHSSNSRSNLSRLKFKSEINPTKNKTAEEELDKEITKDMFNKMEIIGQFNLGFIIVKLDDDLFIIDQHASDEKYNFEDLQKTVVLQSQTLTVPQRLELTAIDEMVLIDNMKIFEANGFKIHVDADALPTKKLKLIAKPFSKNWHFGIEDISDILFMLQDAPPDTMVRPSKVRQMFASRACRKSIMIGQTLNKSTMKRLVNHMGEIEHPWNCPHGRPTMRHLINLAMIETENSDDNED
ncbi:mismatch repair endonuclease PMS2 [Condylostylus longicornis]|uniref:mismatch repair endonuclease PMS2 n=1 Tax=Condylostylus longicornis TaxID=2530218 RepID=UPI00244E3284|nr:mismatch repair endonuclease PMS2 [Condylostylus longicornis]